MKKAKVMLTTIGILAVVGGALAFKAKKFNQTTYCTTTNYVAGGICSTKITQIDFVANQQATLGYYTTTAANCPTNVACTATGVTKLNLQ